MTKEGVPEDCSGPEAPGTQEEDESWDSTSWRREVSVKVLPMCLNTCWGGAKKTETDFSLSCQMPGQETMGTNLNRGNSV